MPYPDFIQGFHAIDVPFPEEVVQTNVVRSEQGLVAFFTFFKDMVLPPHSHGAQWGTVIEGEIEFTIGGEKRICRPGDSYSIPAGVEHGALIKAGTRAIDVFEEPADTSSSNGRAADRQPNQTQRDGMERGNKEVCRDNRMGQGSNRNRCEHLIDNLHQQERGHGYVISRLAAYDARKTAMVGLRRWRDHWLCRQRSESPMVMYVQRSFRPVFLC